MNTPRTLAITLAAVTALAAAGSAFADQATWDVDRALAREAAAASAAAPASRTAAGLAIVVPNDGNYPQEQRFVAQKSRDQVRSETLAAIASGELRAALREGFEGHFAPVPRRDDGIRVATRGTVAR